MLKETWLESQKKLYPEADETVLGFIAGVRFRCGEQGEEIVRTLFRAGYCWYFAHMLQMAFRRGIVCFAYFEGHFVWLDGEDEDADIAYDIDGVNRDWEHLVPEELLKNGIRDFTHVPGEKSGMSEIDIHALFADILTQKKYACVLKGDKEYAESHCVSGCRRCSERHA